MSNPALFRQTIPFEVEAPAMEIPAGKRIPFGWAAKAVDRMGSRRETRLKIVRTDREDAPVASEYASAFFRITAAIDVREEKRIEVVLPHGGEAIGTMDIRYAYALQVFEIPVAARFIPDIVRRGLHLRMSLGEQPLWFFDGADAAGRDIPPTLLPHLLLVRQAENESDRISSFYRQLASLSSIQPFGWMEGCVLDGLFDLRSACPANPGWDKAIRAHWGKFVAEDGGLIYENPRSEPADRRIYGIEGVLPFAVIAKLSPAHPLLDRAIAFMTAHRLGDDGLIADGPITAEGSYTIAYPLAVLARQRERADLAELAVQNLLIRRRALGIDRGLCWTYQDGGRAYERYVNWARACAWHMLGLTRSILELRRMSESIRPSTRELEEECRRMAELARSYQGSDGLWSCFVDDAATGVDTSGSAGMAAAIALASGHGLLPGGFLSGAERAYAGLQAYLTPDGLLTGVAQSNRNGEKLQRSGYRVISQMAMGLMGQLGAALGRAQAAPAPAPGRADGGPICSCNRMVSRLPAA